MQPYQIRSIASAAVIGKRQRRYPGSLHMPAPLKVPDTAKAPFRDEARGNTGPDAVSAVQGLRCPDACVTAVAHRTHLGGWRVGLIVFLPLLCICLDRGHKSSVCTNINK